MTFSKLDSVKQSELFIFVSLFNQQLVNKNKRIKKYFFIFKNYNTKIIYFFAKIFCGSLSINFSIF
ncbi:hypothetical protein HOF65_01490 [bacterium]|nr:hypothetical protein [bacterium]MBT3852701.1 hypothetical protein [bacterium]MBT6778218.1 hypothetical protein [bacterium]